MDTVWRRSRQDIFDEGGPEMAKISGGVKISRFWASSSAKKVLLTAEKVEIGPKMANIHYGVKTSRK